jgi:hypothetical protein
MYVCIYISYVKGMGGKDEGREEKKKRKEDRREGRRARRGYIQI